MNKHQGIIVNVLLLSDNTPFICWDRKTKVNFDAIKLELDEVWIPSELHWGFSYKPSNNIESKC